MQTSRVLQTCPDMSYTLISKLELDSKCEENNVFFLSHYLTPNYMVYIYNRLVCLSMTKLERRPHDIAQFMA